MVLSLLLIVLLSCFGLWLIFESRSATRITGAFERIGETFHLAEGACWLSVKAIDSESISLPTTSNLSNVTPGDSYLSANQSVGKGEITPQIESARDFYNTTPPPGWMLNWQGGTAFYRKFYLTRGQADIPIPSVKGGNARSVLYNLTEKPTR